MVVALGTGLAGCRSAPSPSDALQHTFESPEAVTGAVLEALAADDPDRLAGLALSEGEFRTVVWPELPSSRPERNLTADYVWGDLHEKSRGYMLTLLDAHGGKRYELVEVDFLGGTTHYESFRVHRDSHVTLRDDVGATIDGRLFGSMIESNGRFKVFSFVID